MDYRGSIKVIARFIGEGTNTTINGIVFKKDEWTDVNVNLETYKVLLQAQLDNTLDMFTPISRVEVLQLIANSLPTTGQLANINSITQIKLDVSNLYDKVGKLQSGEIGTITSGSSNNLITNSNFHRGFEGFIVSPKLLSKNTVADLNLNNTTVLTDNEYDQSIKVKDPSSVNIVKNYKDLYDNSDVHYTNPFSVIFGKAIETEKSLISDYAYLFDTERTFTVSVKAITNGPITLGVIYDSGENTEVLYETIELTEANDIDSNLYRYTFTLPEESMRARFYCSSNTMGTLVLSEPKLEYGSIYTGPSLNENDLISEVRSMITNPNLIENSGLELYKYKNFPVDILKNFYSAKLSSSEFIDGAWVDKSWKDEYYEKDDEYYILNAYNNTSCMISAYTLLEDQKEYQSDITKYLLGSYGEERSFFTDWQVIDKKENFITTSIDLKFNINPQYLPGGQTEPVPMALNPQRSISYSDYGYNSAEEFINNEDPYSIAESLGDLIFLPNALVGVDYIDKDGKVFYDRQQVTIDKSAVTLSFSSSYMGIEIKYLITNINWLRYAVTSTIPENAVAFRFACVSSPHIVQDGIVPAVDTGFARMKCEYGTVASAYCKNDNDYAYTHMISTVNNNLLDFTNVIGSYMGSDGVLTAGSIDPIYTKKDILNKYGAKKPVKYSRGYKLDPGHYVEIQQDMSYTYNTLAYQAISQDEYLVFSFLSTMPLHKIDGGYLLKQSKIYSKEMLEDKNKNQPMKVQIFGASLNGDGWAENEIIEEHSIQLNMSSSFSTETYLNYVVFKFNNPDYINKKFKAKISVTENNEWSNTTGYVYNIKLESPKEKSKHNLEYKGLNVSTSFVPTASLSDLFADFTDNEVTNPNLIPNSCFLYDDLDIRKLDIVNDTTTPTTNYSVLDDKYLYSNSYGTTWFSKQITANLDYMRNIKDISPEYNSKNGGLAISLWSSKESINNLRITLRAWNEATESYVYVADSSNESRYSHGNIDAKNTLIDVPLTGAISKLYKHAYIIPYTDIKTKLKDKLDLESLSEFKFMISVTFATGLITEVKTEYLTIDGVTDWCANEKDTLIPLESKPGKIIITDNKTGEIFNDYSNNIASGDYSHAEGYNTQATGNSSHTEGYNTIASKSCSHAEGIYSQAIGDYSHAEGNGTIASRDASHAEGQDTTASGHYSHAEGQHTTSSGCCSHAEGDTATASGESSHAEGSNSIASGNYSHAEGNVTIASKESTHAEGRNTVASANYAHAEGSYSQAQGVASHAEGQNTVAGADYAHAEGYFTSATGNSSHASGKNTKATKEAQTVIGKFNTEDTSTTGQAYYLLIVGNGTSDTARSNALTVDTNGVLEVSGDVKIAGTEMTLSQVISKMALVGKKVIVTNNPVDGVLNLTSDAYQKALIAQDTEFVLPTLAEPKDITVQFSLSVASAITFPSIVKWRSVPGTLETGYIYELCLGYDGENWIGGIIPYGAV